MQHRCRLLLAILTAVVALVTVRAQTGIKNPVIAGTTGEIQTGATLTNKGTLQSANGSTTDLQLGTVLLPSDVTRLGTSIDLSGAEATGTLAAARFPALTGDLSTSAGALATTLATINSNTGSFGSATAAPTFTVDGKGRLTAAGTVTITPAWSSITSKPTTLAGYAITDPIVLTSGSYADPSWITSLAASKLTGTVSTARLYTTAAGYNITGGAGLDVLAGGSQFVQFTGPATSTKVFTLPNASTTIITAADTGSVTNTMLAGSIANAKLANSAITIAGTSTSLGGSITLDTIDNAIASTGLIARTAANTRAARTITGTSGQITVSNGDGVSGNPTVSLPSTITQATVFSGGLTSGVSGSTSSGINSYFQDGSNTGAEVSGLNLIRTTGGTPSATIGIGISFQAPLTTGTNTSEIARIKAENTQAFRSGDLVMMVSQGSSVVEQWRLGRTGNVTMASTTEAGSGVGSLVTAGGISMAKALYVGSNTTSTSTTSGSGIFSGGIGVTGAGYFGGVVDIAQHVRVGTNSGSTIGATPVADIDVQNTNDSTVRYWRSTTEWMQLSAARGGMTGQNNTFLIDRVGPNVSQTRDLKIRSSVDGGTTFKTLVRYSTGDSTATQLNGMAVYWPAITINDSTTSASGTATSNAAYMFDAPTISATNTGVVTSDAATVKIGGDPINGTNNSATRGWGFWNVGNSRVDGLVSIGTTDRNRALNIYGGASGSTGLALVDSAQTAQQVIGFRNSGGEQGAILYQHNATAASQTFQVKVGSVTPFQLGGATNGGAMAVSYTTASTSTTTGSATFGGGIGVVGAGYFGGSLVNTSGVISITPGATTATMTVGQSNSSTAAAVVLATAAGSNASPKNQDVEFRGYDNTARARMRYQERSGDTSRAALTFSVAPSSSTTPTDMLVVDGGQGTGNGFVSFGGLAQLKAYTVSALPTASSFAGALAYVTDANATTRLSTVAGGGSNKVIVFSDGTNWLIL